MLAAAERMGQQGQQPARPQRAGQQVDQQAVGGDVVRTARRRVPRQAQRDERDQRAGQQERRPRPAQHRPARGRHHQRQKRRPPPRTGGVDQAGHRPQLDRVEVVTERLTGDVGDGQRDQQDGAHRPRPRGGDTHPQRAVAGDVEHPAVLRRHEERREHERSDGQHRRDLAGRPHERQPQRGDRAGVGQAGGGQRIGQRQRADAGGGDPGEQRHHPQHRPYRGAAVGGCGHRCQRKFRRPARVISARGHRTARWTAR